MSLMILDRRLVPAPPGSMSELPIVEAGVMETILWRDNEPVFFDDHWARFAAGCVWHRLEIAFSAAEVRGWAEQLARENGIATGVLRFAAWKENATLTWRLEVGPPRLHMSRRSFRVVWGPALPLATEDRDYKHLNRRIWRQAVSAARHNGWDDVLLCDSAGRLIEGGTSNIFFVRENVLHTPAISVGPLPGVMRAQVLSLARELGWSVGEGKYFRDDLSAATEIWFSNSLIGLRPVSVLADRRLADDTPMLDHFRGAWESKHGWDPRVIVPMA